LRRTRARGDRARAPGRRGRKTGLEVRSGKNAIVKAVRREGRMRIRAPGRGKGRTRGKTRKNRPGSVGREQKLSDPFSKKREIHEIQKKSVGTNAPRISCDGLSNGSQHLEACKSWRWGKKTKPPAPVLRWTSVSMMLCARTFGLDQWVASVWTHDTGGLGVVVKKDKTPQSVWWKLVCQEVNPPIGRRG